MAASGRHQALRIAAPATAAEEPPLGRVMRLDCFLGGCTAGAGASMEATFTAEIYDMVSFPPVHRIGVQRRSLTGTMPDGNTL